MGKNKIKIKTPLKQKGRVQNVWIEVSDCDQSIVLKAIP